MGGGGRTFPRGRLIPGLPRGDDATTGLYRRSIEEKVNSACPTSPCWAPGSMVDKMGGGRAASRGRLIPGLPRGGDATTGLYRRRIQETVNIVRSTAKQGVSVETSYHGVGQRRAINRVTLGAEPRHAGRQLE